MTWLNENSAALNVILAALGVILVLLPILWSIFSYINVKKKEAKIYQFETYHGLIKQLVEPDEPDEPKYIDRQVAVIFELRNFRKYYPATLRILQGLKENEAWSKYPRLNQELDLTIKFINKKSWPHHLIFD